MGHEVTRNRARGKKTIVLTCRSCAFFVDDPAVIEAEVPYITTFGSAYSSARGDAGFCRTLDRFQDPLPADYCQLFLLHEDRREQE